MSSPDTHDRFVTYHAEQQRNTSVWEEIPQFVFTVGSADNFDMLQSYSAVYCGDQQEVIMVPLYNLYNKNLYYVLRR